jgi:hypothetical protein
MRLLVRALAALLLAVGLFSGAAHAQTTLPANGPIQAKDYPCAIVLCVLKPNDPQCRPPIEWLLTGFIYKGKPWPTCDFSSSPGTSVSYATQPHVACPSGFTAEQANVNYGSVYTGVCLRPVPTCATKGPQAYQPSVPGGACYTYTSYNNNGEPFTQYFEYVLPVIP